MEELIELASSTYESCRLPVEMEDCSQPQESPCSPAGQTGRASEQQPDSRKEIPIVQGQEAALGETLVGQSPVEGDQYSAHTTPKDRLDRSRERLRHQPAPQDQKGKVRVTGRQLRRPRNLLCKAQSDQGETNSWRNPKPSERQRVRQPEQLLQHLAEPPFGPGWPSEFRFFSLPGRKEGVTKATRGHRRHACGRPSSSAAGASRPRRSAGVGTNHQGKTRPKASP